MFTQNRVQAAPVVVSRAHLEQAEPQAIVINTGVANAATGAQGDLDAIATASEAARLLCLRTEEVLVLSTGVIGVPLPMEKVARRHPRASRRSRPRAAPSRPRRS